MRSGGNAFVTMKLMRHESIASTERYVRWAVSGQEIVSGLYEAA